jgi:hypothetical protein
MSYFGNCDLFIEEQFTIEPLLPFFLSLLFSTSYFFFFLVEKAISERRLEKRRKWDDSMTLDCR